MEKKCNLILHCGAQAVSREELSVVHTPEPTATWVPVSHLNLVQTVEHALLSTGLSIVNQVHSISQAGARYFGLTQVRGVNDPVDYSWVLGIRNSHDKRFPAGIVAGASVFVCDNLSFSGEVKLSRKHTTNLLRDLPQLAAGAVGKLMNVWHHQGDRIERYKSHRLTDKAAHDLVVRSVDVGACPNRLIPSVLQEWRYPSHEEFRSRTAWSLFNAFTEVLKGNLCELPNRTERLHALFDHAVGLTGVRNES